MPRLCAVEGHLRTDGGSVCQGVIHVDGCRRESGQAVCQCRFAGTTQTIPFEFNAEMGVSNDFIERKTTFFEEGPGDAAYLGVHLDHPGGKGSGLQGIVEPGAQTFPVGVARRVKEREAISRVKLPEGVNDPVFFHHQGVALGESLSEVPFIGWVAAPSGYLLGTIGDGTDPPDGIPINFNDRRSV